jgi:predicted nucleotidyltransferase
MTRSLPNQHEMARRLAARLDAGEGCGKIFAQFNALIDVREHLSKDAREILERGIRAHVQKWQTLVDVLKGRASTAEAERVLAERVERQQVQRDAGE